MPDKSAMDMVEKHRMVQGTKCFADDSCGGGGSWEVRREVYEKMITTNLVLFDDIV